MSQKKKKSEEVKSYYYWDTPGAEEDIPQKDRPYRVLKRKRTIPKDD